MLGAVNNGCASPALYTEDSFKKKIQKKLVYKHGGLGKIWLQSLND